MNTSLPFRLFSCCIPVRGVERSIVCDVQRGSFQFIPNSLFEILTRHNGKAINYIKSFYENSHNETIQEYFDFLLKNEYIFLTKNPDYFPLLDLSWKHPSIITNALIDVDTIGEDLPWQRLFKEFEALSCKHLQVRCLCKKEMGFFEHILTLLEGKSILSIELLIKHDDCIEEQRLWEWCESFPRISNIYVHSAPSNISPDQINYMGNVFFIENKIENCLQCGNISRSYFSNNISTFTEAHHHNTCLNRKISIDTEGNIKNCPSMKESYGNIRDTTLQEALEKPGFKKYWNITKDQVEGCKDCEFRYICTDCRAYLEDPENILSKPLKCGYNPHTCKWEEWSTHPLKQKAIKYYGMQELVMSV